MANKGDDVVGVKASSTAGFVPSQAGTDEHESKLHPTAESAEPIAIIGMGCRLPGTAQDPSSFWDMLVSRRTAWTPVPETRFNVDAFYDPSLESGGTTSTYGGHFLKEDVAAFDASFFGIQPVEAMAMDPQHRLLLEIAYETFQNAGVRVDSLWNSDTGVYVGQWSTDYHDIETRDIDSPPLYLITGTGPALSSNRISRFFNLRGPSFTIDTGCSSSLVALHQAVQSLRSGESAQCFVGGVNLLLDPQRFVYQGKLKMLSKDGRSYAFDSRASGYGRGEGCVGVMLKPLSAALQDGNRVRAVIRNSILNQDGRTPGVAVPSANAQKEAILKAYRKASLSLDPDYVEAHGTGTPVGDPIEATAIAMALTQDKPSNFRLPIGSGKANIGHTEGAAGLAGLIKAVLMLEHGIIPPQANYEKSNPNINLDQLKLRIPTELDRRALRRISVNSFGYGGTNAHVVVDSAVGAMSSISARLALHNGLQHITLAENRPQIFVVSAASEKACQRICRRLARYLVLRHRGSPMANVVLAMLAYTLEKQTTHPHRLALVSSNIDDLICKLIAAVHSPIPRTCFGKQRKPCIALVFSGQGAQYAGMGRELLDGYPTFARSLQHAQQLLLTELGSRWDLLHELGRPEQESRIHDPAIAQPCSTAIQLALVDLLSGLGVCPCAVVGHSSGEIAAAYAAGLISFEDAMTVSYFRGKLVSELARVSSRSGAMLAVGADSATSERHIRRVGPEYGTMSIACFNCQASVTVSGDSAAIDELKRILDAEGLFNRKLMTNGAAYHSHHMEPVAVLYETALKILDGPRKATASPIRMFSSVTGTEGDKSTVASRIYWVKNLLSPVLFSQAFGRMCQQDYQGRPLDIVVEIGPSSQLEGPVNHMLKAMPERLRHTSYISSLKKGQRANISLLECLGALNIHGAPLPIHELNRVGSRVCHPDPALELTDLPPYPFDHDRNFWHETRISTDYRQRRFLPHELLGTLSLDFNRLEPRWRQFLSLKTSPWLRSHMVQGQVVFPAAGYLTMAMQAIQQHIRMTNSSSKVKSISMRNVSFEKGIVLSKDGPDVEIVLSLRPEACTARESSTVWSEFHVFTVDCGRWTEHCRGLTQAETRPLEAYNEKYRQHLSRVHAHCTRELPPQEFYNLGHGIDIDWLNPFNNITSFRTCPNACIATAHVLDLAPLAGGVDDIIHPAMLDSCLFHGLVAVQLCEKGVRSTFVPTFIKQLRITSQPVKAGSKLISASTSYENEMGRYDVVMQHIDEHGRSTTFLEAQGVNTTTLPGNSMFDKVASDICHKLEWVTYTDYWTAEHRDRVCKSVLQPANAVEQNILLEKLALQYVQRTLREWGADDVPSDHRRHYFAWMQSFAREYPGEVSHLPENDAALNTGSFGEAIHRVGPRLADILRQKVDPLSLLLPDNLLARVYNSERCQRCIAQMAEYCHQLGRQTPGLRVLEVGAGTGSATLPILEALNGREGRYVERYDFTDISPGYFETSRERLGKLVDVVEFLVLDIGRSGKEQGFEEASYDLIVASNVIHATPRIGFTLGNVRRLLKQNGRILLMELTKPMAPYNLLFGVFEGWWAGVEEGRNTSPLLSRSRWLSELESAGFFEPENLFEDYLEDDGGSISVLTAKVYPLDSPSTELPPIHLLTVPGSSITERRVSPLREALPGAQIAVSLLPSTSEGGNIVLILPDIAEMLCMGLDADCWGSFKHWILKARAVILVSCGRVDSLDHAIGGVWVGFVRCLRSELPQISLITFDIQDRKELLLEKLAGSLPTLTRAILAPTPQGKQIHGENEFTEKDGQLFVSRLMPCPDASNHVHRSMRSTEPEMVPFMDKGRTLIAELATPGLMETFRWKDDDSRVCQSLGSDDVKLELRAASINFKDVLIATGQLNGITDMRNDCSGVVVEVGTNMRDRFKPGDAVYALSSPAYANYPVVHGDCCHAIPGGMSFEEAASMPIAWSTAYYSLVDMGHLAKGDTVLIHSAAGAVGQAAVMLAHHFGAEVFLTAGNAQKRQLLHDRYGVPYERMFCSRTLGFSDRLKSLTNDRGVDVVLNSLSGDMFRESCNVLAPFGRFVEIGRKYIMDDALMPMSFLLKNITFAYVDLGMVIEKRRPLARRLLQDVTSLAEAGHIRPVTLTIMPISEIETAFRLIQAAKHTGKIVLSVRENQTVMSLPLLPAQAQLHSDGTYVVVGGFGGLGRAIIRWMAEHGARHIMSISRSAAKGIHSRALIDELCVRGVRLSARKCDVAVREEVISLVDDIQSQGGRPIRGIIHSAMALQDSVLETMSVDQWLGALAPKVRGTLNLHSCVPSNSIDFFIMLSSTVTLRGNASQSNYAGACSFQDSMARHRWATGLPAYTINVGPVLEAGFVAENPDVAARFQRQGVNPITISHLLALINLAVTRSHSGGGGDDPGGVVRAIGLPGDNGVEGSLFAHLVKQQTPGQKTEKTSVDLDQALSETLRLEEAADIVCDAILRQLGKLILAPVEALSSTRSLDDHGVDSLVAVELRNWIATNLQVNLQLMALRGFTSIKKLAAAVAQETPLFGSM